MIYKITAVGIGFVTQAGQVGSDLRIRIDGGDVRSLSLDGNRYPVDDSGVAVVPVKALKALNEPTAVTKKGDEIPLESFAYSARDNAVLPAWGREIVALATAYAEMSKKISRIKSRLLTLEKAIEPADNDLCI